MIKLREPKAGDPIITKQKTVPRDRTIESILDKEEYVLITRRKYLLKNQQDFLDRLLLIKEEMGIFCINC